MKKVFDTVVLLICSTTSRKRHGVDCVGYEKAKLGLRGVVHPAIKDEFHPERISVFLGDKHENVVRPTRRGWEAVQPPAGHFGPVYDRLQEAI